MIEKIMKVYIDDMLVKILKAGDHVVYLEEIFCILRKLRMMLNPSKCIYGVIEQIPRFSGNLKRNLGKFQPKPSSTHDELA